MSSGGRHIGSAFINSSVANEAPKPISDQSLENVFAIQEDSKSQAASSQRPISDFSDLPLAPSATFPTILENATVDQAAEILRDLVHSINRLLDEASRKQYNEILDQLISGVDRISELESQSRKQLEEIRLSRAELDQYRSRVESEVKDLSTQHAELQTNVKGLEEQLKKAQADVIKQLRKVEKEKLRFNETRDSITQLNTHWLAQKEDLRRQQIEIDEANQASRTLQHDAEECQKQLQERQVKLYADKKALERAQKLVEHDHKTVVTYAKEIEEKLLKTDPAYVPAETEDHLILTTNISHALIDRFNDMREQLREEQSIRQHSAAEVASIHLQNDKLSTELIELKASRGEETEKFSTLVDEHSLLQELRATELETRKKLESADRLIEDRCNILMDLEQKARKCNVELKENLQNVRLERDEVKEKLTVTEEQKLQLNDMYNELLAELDTVRKDNRQKGKQLMTEQTKSSKLQEEVAENARARRSAGEQVATLQSGYDEIRKQVDALKRSELELQTALDEELNAHARTKGAYSELDKRIGAADRDTHSARRELNQQRAQHAANQLRVEQLKGEVQQLTDWKEKTTASLNTMSELATSMFDVLTSRQDDDAQQVRTADRVPIPNPPAVGLDDETLLVPSSPLMPAAKRLKIANEAQPKTYSKQARQNRRPNDVRRQSAPTLGDSNRLSAVEDEGQNLSSSEREREKEGTELEGLKDGFPDAVKSTECVTAHISEIRNSTDDSVLPAEVKKLVIEKFKGWDRRTPTWASKPRSNSSEIKCCDHMIQRKPCQWHEDEDGLPNFYRACERCAYNKKVCTVLTGVDEILVLPLSDEDREKFYPNRTSFGKEDVAYWVRETDD